MLDKIKYIDAYQVAPVSGITHIAEVERIDKYKDTNKYMLYFKSHTTVEIHKIGLGKKKCQVTNGSGYSSYEQNSKAKNLDDLWK